MEESSYQVNENDGSVSVRVVLTGQTAVDIAGRYHMFLHVSTLQPICFSAIAKNEKP